MTWEASSLFVLLAALGFGFASWERSRPPAKMLALVATLAALAAVGRIAFAPVPNVKPTTDIVLLSGWALGGPAGFTVGAVAAVASNFALGQGAWTPWQMGAWGLVGLAGAGLARLFRGRTPSRWTLAAICAAAGFAYGAILDVAQWVMFSGDHTLAKLGAVMATSFPWNVAHAAGNVAFGLLFGPALLRTLQRFRARLTVDWAPGPLPVPSLPAVAGTALALVLALAILAPGDGRAASPRDYLRAAQNADGGWGAARGDASSPLFSAWGTLGLAATGVSPQDARRRAGRSALAYLGRTARGMAKATDIERTLLVLGAAGVSSRSFAGRDLRGALLRQRRGDGSFASQVNPTAFGILGLRASGLAASHPAVDRAGTWLAGQGNPDGGFSFFRRGGPADVDSTGGALQALVASGRGASPVAGRAADWLARQQNRDGGFPTRPGATSNAQSTAWAVQGFAAVGRNPDGVRRAGRSPLGYLRGLVSADGSVRYSATSRQTPVWVTAQTALALGGRPFPLAPVPRATRAPRRVAPATPAAAAPSEPDPGAGDAVDTASSTEKKGAGVPKRPSGRDPKAVIAPSIRSWARTAGYATGLVLEAVGSPP